MGERRIRVDVEHVAINDQGDNERRAAGVTRQLLGMWRNRFTEGAQGNHVEREYNLSDIEKIKVTSPAADAVTVRHQQGEGIYTTYEYGAGEITVQQQIGDEAPHPVRAAPLMQHAGIQHLLFMSDRIEARGA